MMPTATAVAATAVPFTAAAAAPDAARADGRRLRGAPTPQTLMMWRVELHSLAQRIGAGDAAAPAALQALIGRIQAHDDAASTGVLVFAAALAARVAGGGAEAANLYLRRFEVPQIELFNLLGRHVPMVRLATRIANDTLAQALRGQAHPTLIDVGIGTGRQFAALLDELALAGALPAALTVVGIEPAADALAQARSTLQAQARRLGLPLHFHGVALGAEAMDEADWAGVAAACSAPPVVNASFALHHIADDGQGRDRRNAVLRRLHALAPQLLVMAEPDVDHREADLGRRFENCFEHFGAVFEVLDALPLQPAERNALKAGFFGREIVDVLASPEPLRSERHESTAAWFQRLAATGFELRPSGLPLPASSHPSVQVMQRGLRAAICAGDRPLVSVFAARPAA